MSGDVGRGALGRRVGHGAGGYNASGKRSSLGVEESYVKGCEVWRVHSAPWAAEEYGLEG